MVIQSYSGEIVGRVEKRGLAEVEYSTEYGCQPNSRARTGAIGATGSGSPLGKRMVGSGMHTGPPVLGDA
ncbi:hypothetical protein N7519_009746 [Penicillium mononematosum]|uniref:uncharacterized protein n=1 Tax=Penicillium mononematosum TaxID=268346 RepID=UPI002547A29C|nr:uncharacterized protein N7519_009746 [Penicillium mononematosum]KAJ6179285.1 hypothetical protein N7519_009746 [Penicillium mononematosum]